MPTPQAALPGRMVHTAGISQAKPGQPFARLGTPAAKPARKRGTPNGPRPARPGQSIRGSHRVSLRSNTATPNRSPAQRMRDRGTAVSFPLGGPRVLDPEGQTAVFTGAAPSIGL